MANEKLTPPGGWNPHLISSITSLTGSRLAPQPPDEQPRLRWETSFGKTDLELRRNPTLSSKAVETRQFTLWINSDLYRSEKEALALRGLALMHNLIYTTSGDTDENL
jgi:hypothetical protein